VGPELHLYNREVLPKTEARQAYRLHKALQAPQRQLTDQDEESRVSAMKVTEQIAMVKSLLAADSHGRERDAR